MLRYGFITWVRPAGRISEKTEVLRQASVPECLGTGSASKRLIIVGLSSRMLWCATVASVETGRNAASAATALAAAAAESATAIASAEALSCPRLPNRWDESGGYRE